MTAKKWYLPKLIAKISKPKVGKTEKSLILHSKSNNKKEQNLKKKEHTYL